MQSLRIAIGGTENLRWPTGCAACGIPADRQALASISTSENFQYYGVLLKWSQRTLSLPYPVCQKHQMICRLLNIPAKLGFIKGFLCLVLVPTFLWIAAIFLVAVTTGLRGDALDPFSTAFALLFYGTTTIFFIAAATLKPIQLLAVDGKSLTITFRNRNYFDSFKLLNLSDDSIR
jgi:hypothetical protein